MDLKNRVGLITGAASDIGNAIAIRLAAHGNVPVIADLNLDAAQATKDEIRKSGTPLRPARLRDNPSSSATMTQRNREE